MRPKKWTDEQIRAAWERHKTLTGAAASIGMSESGFRLRALALGLSGWQRFPRAQRPTDAPPTWRERKILQAAATHGCEEAARLLGVTPTWVRIVVLRHGAGATTARLARARLAEADARGRLAEAEAAVIRARQAHEAAYAELREAQQAVMAGVSRSAERGRAGEERAAA